MHEICDEVIKPAAWLKRAIDVHHVAMGQNPVPPVNIPIPTKIHLPQNGTIGFDPQPCQNLRSSRRWQSVKRCMPRP